MDKLDFYDSSSVHVGAKLRCGNAQIDPEFLVQDSNGNHMLSVGNDGVDFAPSDELIEKLWDKMYSMPAIIPCQWCGCHNAYTNPACVQCGGPMT